MSEQKPQKPKRPRSKKLKLNKREEWERILKDVEKRDVPVSFLQKVVIELRDGTEVNIDIQELLDEGHDPSDIEFHLNKRLNDLDHIINDVNFYISIDHVSKTVQPFTDKLLKDL